MPQRIRAVLLHVIHIWSTNDLALQQPQLTHGLSRVAEHGDEYLDSDDAVEAIAAAAIIASQLPGGTAIDTAYAPDFLLEGGTVEVANDVPAIAVQALDRIISDDSEWRELWEEAEESYQQALASVQSVRATLEQAVGR